MQICLVDQDVLIQVCNVMTMYSDVNYTDDGSCEYPVPLRDCAFNCINDADGDDVCDEEEIAGCQDDAYVILILLQLIQVIVSGY